MTSGFVACSTDDTTSDVEDGTSMAGAASTGGGSGSAGAEAVGGARPSVGGDANLGGDADRGGRGGAGSGNGGVAAAPEGGVAGARTGGRDGNGGSSDSAGASGDTSGPSATGGGGGESGTAPGNSGVDAFGIRRLYPSASSGAEWSSAHWNRGTAYSITSRIDANDPLRISGMRGDGTLRVTGTGELVMGGSQPRIYVYPPNSGPWRDVEVTVYYQRVDDEATAYAGLVVGARSGEGHNDDTACNAHTYYARLRHDGAIDFEKELEHPASSTRERVAPATVWPPDGKLPFGTWIGWKFVVYNASATSVKLESYRDLTGGVNGGDWKLMSQTTDSGGWSVEDDCPEHDPENGQSDMVIVEGGFTFIRNTDVTEARYRWFTIREIAP